MSLLQNEKGCWDTIIGATAQNYFVGDSKNLHESTEKKMR